MTDDDNEHFDPIALADLQQSLNCSAQRLAMAIGEEGLLVVQSFHNEVNGPPVAHVIMPIEMCFAGLMQQLQTVTHFCRQLNEGDPALAHVAAAIDVKAQMERIWETISQNNFKMENKRGEPIFRPSQVH